MWSYYGALVVAERTWRYCVRWNCAHNVGGGIPPLLFLLGRPGSMTGTRRSICPLSVPFWGTVRLCDDARYPAILWPAADEEYKNDYPDDYNEKAEQELTRSRSSCSTCCRTNCCGTSPCQRVRLSAALRHPRLVTDLSKEVKHFALDKSSWAYFLYELQVFRAPCCAAGCRIKSFVVPWGNRRLLYDTGDHRDYRLLMNPAGNPTVDMICMIVIGFRFMAL